MSLSMCDQHEKNYEVDGKFSEKFEQGKYTSEQLHAHAEKMYDGTFKLFL
jgi:hypothetical protein